MKDILAMVDGTVLYNVHTADRCAGQPCCIHNPTKHHMADWPPRWDSDWKQMWRVCPHGFNHPDPDDAVYLRRKADATARMWHGCDGCCQPPLPEQRKGIEAKPEPRLVKHDGDWRPADLQIDAAGNTRPGFICVHQLENGMGQCGGNVFRVEDEIGQHSCWVLP